MRITCTTIECKNGNGDVEITAIEGGARVAHVRPWKRTAPNRREVLGEMKVDDGFEQRLAIAMRVASAIYGTDPKRGGPSATNSMVHDVMQAIERVAGA